MEDALGALLGAAKGVASSLSLATPFAVPVSASTEEEEAKVEAATGEEEVSRDTTGVVGPSGFLANSGTCKVCPSWTTPILSRKGAIQRVTMAGGDAAGAGTGRALSAVEGA